MAVILAIIGIIPKRSVISNNLKFYKSYYLTVMIISFILTLGSPLTVFGIKTKILLPDYFLYKYVPGIKGMRNLVSFIYLFLISLSFFAALGLEKVKSIAGDKAGIVYLLIIIAITMEYCSIPIPIKKLETGNQVPEIYQWLASQKDQFTIVEFPIEYKSPFEDVPIILSGNVYTQYYSIYHWKNVVGGYAALVPPIPFRIFQNLRTFPSRDSINCLKELNIKYILLHKTMPLFNEIDNHDARNILKAQKCNQNLQVQIAKLKTEFHDILFLHEFKNTYLFKVNKPEVLRGIDKKERLRSDNSPKKVIAVRDTGK
ncbi:MAG: hypothetical protein A2161_18775 [Candidatus Schekmanbacteria bacterium RBG_13_48_7]|uniref:Uncharacterized protein n=1 Tax=Candidatus Schekmanbacteria bacterium RBG_13_48_7 TaxID=1817878 RepID=A0A1F7S0U3_9BACT|nr:MAG: hypothetical protein A2161_18775 [Candidatus Schekmanbacteria bacterium RBG_13_48_7]